MSAMRLVLTGGVLGFAVAMGGLLLSLSPWAAFGIWAASGPVGALLAIAQSQLKAQPVEELRVCSSGDSQATLQLNTYGALSLGYEASHATQSGQLGPVAR